MPEPTPRNAAIRPQNEFLEVSLCRSISPAEVEDGNVLLLCSDGFWGPLEEMEFLCLQNALPLPAIVGELIDRAVLREAGYADNTTVVVVRLGPNEPDHPAESPVCAPLNIT